MRLIDADYAIEQMQDILDVVDFRAAVPLPIIKALVCAALKSEGITPTMKNRWISVEDGLPEEGVWVLVWEKQGFAYCDMLASGVWQIGDNNGAIITHWMQLPETPEEEEHHDGN